MSYFRKSTIYPSLRHRKILQSSGYLRSFRWLTCLSGWLINDVLQFNGSFYSEAVYLLWLRIWILQIYENSKVKFIWATLIINTRERVFQNYFAHNLLNDLDLKTLSSIRTMTILQNPRSRVKQNLWTALSRPFQASSLLASLFLLMSIDYFQQYNFA